MKRTLQHAIALFSLLTLAACNSEPPETEKADTADMPGTEAPLKSVEATGSTESADRFDIMVMGGAEDVLAWMNSEDGWAGVADDPGRGVPYTVFTAVHPGWAEASKSMTVQQKKQVFYRFMLPLILHANHMVRDNRARLLAMQAQVSSGETLGEEQLALLREGLELFRVTDTESIAAIDSSTPELASLMDELALRLDEIPAGLALGQSAYESGYGTSRFALQGNALFGQASFDAEGMKAAHAKPVSEGGHRIAAFDWPFDSVRGYFINLNSHPAYEDFRQMRAEQRAAGEPLDSLKLADGLLRYSTRGQDYIDDLKGIISHNGLDRADTAELRDEQMRFLVVADDERTEASINADIAEMRANGELQQIYEQMALE